MQVKKPQISDCLHVSKVSLKFHILILLMILQQFIHEICYIFKKYPTL